MNAIAIERLDLHEEALADLFQSFHPRVLGICRRFLGSTEAEDASSEIFLRLPKAVRTYDSAMPFSRWLSSVVGHYCVDLLRKRRSEQRLFQPANPDKPEPATPTRLLSRRYCEQRSRKPFERPLLACRSAIDFR